MCDNDTTYLVTQARECEVKQQEVRESLAVALIALETEAQVKTDTYDAWKTECEQWAARAIQVLEQLAVSIDEDLASHTPCTDETRSATAYKKVEKALVNLGHTARHAHLVIHGKNTEAHALCVHVMDSHGFAKAGGFVCALLAHNRVDPGVDDSRLLRRAAACGHVEILCALLLDHRSNPRARNSEALVVAARNGHERVVYELLTNGRADPATKNNEALLSAAERQHTGVLQLLLRDGRVNAAARDDEALVHAARHDKQEVLRMLLANNRTNPAARDSLALQKAALCAHVEVVHMLLQDRRADPNGNGGAAIVTSLGHWKSGAGADHELSCRRLEVLHALLADGRANPCAQDNAALVHAAAARHGGFLDALLQDGRVIAWKRNFGAALYAACEARNFTNMHRLLNIHTYADNTKFDIPTASSLRYAAFFGQLDVVEVLLASSHCDPGKDDTAVLRDAVEGGYVGSVRLLLADPRVDPSTKHINAAICDAASHNSLDILSLLLAHPHADPSFNDSAPLRLAAENGHFLVVKLLLEDGRVEPAAGDSVALRRAVQCEASDIVKLLLAAVSF